MSAGQITEKSELERNEIDKAMKQLKSEEAIVFPKHCYWSVKE